MDSIGSRGWRQGAAMVALLTALVSGCDGESPGFALPEGDADQGRVAFVNLGCTGCHSVMGDPSLSEQAPDAKMRVILGGSASRVQTYGNLVTSIINPSHYLKRGEPALELSPRGISPMPSLNEEMSVAELVDLVAFLKGHYKVWTPPTSYPAL